MERARFDGIQIEYAKDAAAVAKGADAVVILTEWPQFKQLDWKAMHDSMARPLLLDGRNLLDPAAMKAIGFEYHSIGRPD
jgi:UDPglucose 6-dehydrogenase